jgi:hypothetical protein
MKNAFFALALFLSCHCNAQIVLKGYKCKFYDGQMPDLMAEMYSKNDTFRSTFYGRDISEEVTGNNPKEMLKAGLKLCCEGEHYTKTKDSLYILTGKYDYGVYYYKVYDPNATLLISLRTRNNDSLFSEKSKWLLSQIRLHRKKGAYLLNEKGQTCLEPDNPAK